MNTKKKETMEVGTGFRVLEGFRCEAVRTTYMEGLSYRVTPETFPFASKWLKDGKIKKTTVGPSVVIGGTGKVT